MCIQLNAEFQRLARKHKKAFFNEQHIKVEENNRLEISSRKLEGKETKMAEE